MLRLPAALPADAPATLANIRRNARGEPDRHTRWHPARDALWQLLDQHVCEHARVAVVGAGNTDDLPLRRLAQRAATVDLLDIDPDAPRHARSRLPGWLRRRVSTHTVDVTAGAADRIARAARDGSEPQRPTATVTPLSSEAYDVVIGDLFYSQLIAPALGDLDVDHGRVAGVLRRYGQPLTDSVVARLHASASAGVVIHVHDPLAWRPGPTQPFTIEHALSRAAHDPRPAHVLAGGHTPLGCDPRHSVDSLGLTVLATAWWRWPFTCDVDYLVCATVSANTSPQPSLNA